MSTTPLPPEERAALAAEHALGLTEGDDLVTALRLERDDPAFRAEVARWLTDFAPLLDGIEPSAPVRDLYPAIAARLALVTNVVAFRRRVRRWQGFTAAASGLAAALAIALIVRQPAPVVVPPPAAPISSPAPMVAMLGSDTGPARLVATWSAAERRLLVVPAAGVAAEPGRSHQLWRIDAAGTPHPMGLIRESEPIQLTLPEAEARTLADGIVLAVSIEPQGGSPTGLPTGPVIAAGPLRRA
jgi:anti-sigma-K factor RskA